MNTHFLKFLTLPIVTVLFISVAGAVSLTVQYKTYGVPDHRREEYAKKVQVIREREKVLSGEISTADLPKAVIASKTHDFGMIDPHITATHDFTIRNEGNGPLALKVNGTSCKCTVGRLANDYLAPGEETTITMEWNTGYQADHYEQTAIIQTNDPLQKEITLTVEGEVRAQLVAPETIGLKAEKLGDLASGEFVLFSQLWSDFTVMSITGEGTDADLNWDVTPIENDDIELADKQSRSAVRVKLSLPHHRYGEFNGKFNVVVRPGDGTDDITREVNFTGKVRRPISFVSPQLDMVEGLRMGMMSVGEESIWHLIVQVRGAEGRKIEVLDVEPKIIQAEIQPTSREGNYRLTLKIPADCPSTIFNLDHQRGYVQVGDPDDKEFMNWFPVLGAVVNTSR